MNPSPSLRPPRVPRLRPRVALVALVGLIAAGCGGSPPTGTTDPPAKLRLERLLEYYRSYAAEKKKPPPDEKALKDYIAGLPADRREAAGMVEGVDELFVSPRDGQKYVVRYKVRLNPGAEPEAVAWEAVGQGGTRFVALSIGYVQEYGEEEFKELKKQ
jgi:hypothetical protein